MPLEQTKSLYRRTLKEEVAIRRYGGSGASRPFFDYPCHAQVVGYQPDELVPGSGLQQGDRKAIVLAEDLVNGQFPFPVTINDKLMLRGKELAILAPDDSTRRDEGILVALEMTVRG